MKKRTIAVLLAAMMVVFAFTACGSNSESSSDSGEDKTEITIAAAASLENVFKDEIIPEFEKANPDIKVTGTYDASGKLQTQIEEGASIDVFFSAATKQMDALVDKDLVDKDSVVDILENQIVLITAKDSKTDITKYGDIVNADKIAMGDPKSVPAGQYAKESFENLGIWDQIKAKDVSYGTNVTEVLNWVAEGSADVGVVYKSDALSMKDKVKIIDTAPADSVSKCIYPVGLVTAGKHKDEAKKLIEYMQTDDVIKVFEDYGFKSNL
ncbi:MAG: molybdate ABC transporter substrate-binding protein [Eubacteriaceae bacterium]|nr:molybdate ABC transporter substrate-binding protein [Eubacteriaceae bacterium]